MPPITYKKETLEAFLDSTTRYAWAVARKADEDGGGVISRAESEDLGDMKDTYDLYLRKGEHVGVEKFVKFYVRRAEMAVKAGELPSDLQDNIQNWLAARADPSVVLSTEERLAAVRAVYAGIGGVDDNLAPMIAVDEAPEVVQAGLQEAVADFEAYEEPGYVLQEPADVTVHKVYVSESNQAVAAYLVHAYIDLGNGEDLAFLDRAFAPDGRMIMDEIDYF